jgi:hypothetical protein
MPEEMKKTPSNLTLTELPEGDDEKQNYYDDKLQKDLKNN